MCLDLLRLDNLDKSRPGGAMEQPEHILPYDDNRKRSGSTPVKPFQKTSQAERKKEVRNELDISAPVMNPLEVGRTRMSSRRWIYRVAFMTRL